MAPNVEDINDEPPTSINPYEVLGVEEKATADQIKSAYRSQALKHHPDKASPDAKEAANLKFQEIAFAYAILSDERRRKRYDATGNTSESLGLDDDDFSWMEYFREQYSTTISLEILEKTKREYQGSDEEKQHLFDAYEKYDGDLNKIYEVIMLSNPLNDEARFCAVLDRGIKDGEIKAHKKYTEEPNKRKEKRLANARAEAEKAEEALQEIETTKAKKAGSSRKSNKKGGNDADLVALIQQRRTARVTNFLDDLEAKYGGASKGPSGKGARKRMSEPTEEAFAEVGARASKKAKDDEKGKRGKRGKRSKA